MKNVGNFVIVYRKGKGTDFGDYTIKQGGKRLGIWAPGRLPDALEYVKSLGGTLDNVSWGKGTESDKRRYPLGMTSYQDLGGSPLGWIVCSFFES